MILTWCQDTIDVFSVLNKAFSCFSLRFSESPWLALNLYGNLCNWLESKSTMTMEYFTLLIMLKCFRYALHLALGQAFRGVLFEGTSSIHHSLFQYQASSLSHRVTNRNDLSTQRNESLLQIENQFNFEITLNTCCVVYNIRNK